MRIYWKLVHSALWYTCDGRRSEKLITVPTVVYPSRVERKTLSVLQPQSGKGRMYWIRTQHGNRS